VCVERDLERGDSRLPRGPGLGRQERRCCEEHEDAGRSTHVP